MYRIYLILLLWNNDTFEERIKNCYDSRVAPTWIRGCVTVKRCSSLRRYWHSIDLFNYCSPMFALLEKVILWWLGTMCDFSSLLVCHYRTLLRKIKKNSPVSLSPPPKKTLPPYMTKMLNYRYFLSTEKNWCIKLVKSQHCSF